MPEPQINPWSNNQSVDVEKLFSDFGIEPIAPVIQELPDVPYFMSRGIVVGHRDYHQIATAIRNCTPFHVLTGFMPSGHPHLGHLMVMKEVVWHVEQGGNGYVTIADREAHAVRGISWEKCKEFGKEYLANGEVGSSKIAPVRRTKYVSSAQMQGFLRQVTRWQMRQYIKPGLRLRGPLFMVDCIRFLLFYKRQYDFEMDQLFRWNVQQYTLQQVWK